MKGLAARLAATVLCSLTAIAATAAEPKFNRSSYVDKEIHHSIPVTKQDCLDLLVQRRWSLISKPNLRNPELGESTA